MKILTFYLPQFHTIPENDKWWGKGFTEWTNTKKTKPLFKNHNQPREPLGDNYYDLSDIEVMKWQAKIAQDHGIYGFCYYHYWFNGKKLLEKPLENMLKDKDVTIPFCLSWANESWTRAWDGGEKDVLMPQEYGHKKEWKEHFNYLVDFFKDERYIKIENKPMFVIYRTNNIPNVNEMIDYWNSLTQEHGFSGLYIVETFTFYQNSIAIESSEAVIEFEPAYTMANVDSIKKKILTMSGVHINQVKYRIFDKIHNFIYPKIVKTLNYDLVWWDIITRKSFDKSNKKRYLGAFIDWDNTPRKGKSAFLFRNVSVEKFKFYLSRQLIRAQKHKSEFLFINAWNEWAEGTYLEPDKKNGLKYLEVIKKLMNKYE